VDRWVRTPFLSGLATAVLAISAIYFAEPVLAPLAAAGILSIVLGGAVKRVERLGFGSLRLGRVAAVLVVALGITGAFAGMGWIVASEGSELATHLPEYRRNLHARARAPIDALESAMRQVRNGSAAGAPEAPHRVELLPSDGKLVGFVAGWAGSLASIAASAGIVVVLLIFLLIERDDLRDRLLRVAGRGELRLTGSALGEASERVARYLRALALLNCGHGLAVGIGLAVLGVPGALLFGLLAALLRFVPYAGPLIAACAPLALSVAVFDDWTRVLWVASFLGALEIISNNFVEPHLIGARVGLSPFAVILSAIFWAWLWGPIGLVLATPLTVCVVVMGRHLPGLETLSILLGDSQVLQPFERIYERLLARDLESASTVVAAENREQSAPATWDHALVPVLRLLEHDRRTQALESDDVTYVREAFDVWIAELTEAPLADAAAATQPAPILCAPAGAFADEIVSAGLARMLESRGLPARSLVHLLTSELVEAAAREGGGIVCLSALDSRAAPVRHLLRRLTQSAPLLRIVVGLWGVDAARAAELRSSLGDSPGVELVTTLEEAVELLWSRSRLQPPSTVRAAS
jgi:predicted PurR-regulated permease PerM